MVPALVREPKKQTFFFSERARLSLFPARLFSVSFLVKVDFSIIYRPQRAKKKRNNNQDFLYK